jgi:hypothetical protein
MDTLNQKTFLKLTDYLAYEEGKRCLACQEFCPKERVMLPGSVSGPNKRAIHGIFMHVYRFLTAIYIEFDQGKAERNDNARLRIVVKPAI